MGKWQQQPFVEMAMFTTSALPTGGSSQDLFVAITLINLIQHIQLAEFVWIVHQQFNFDLLD